MKRAHEKRLLVLVLFVIGWTCASRVDAQLQITEIMYDTAADEGVWEWFEIFNSGNHEIDLDGYVFDDFSLTTNARQTPNIQNVDSRGKSANTVVPSGAVAVIYNGAKLEFDASRFRSAWSLDPSVPMIGVDGFQPLNNSGDSFGLWSSIDSYSLDLQNTDEDEALEVATFDEAAAWIDFGAQNFPTAKNASLEWNGMGGYRDGVNWHANSDATGNVRTSVETMLPTSPLNSEKDIGNPGLVLGRGEPGTLVITELMYNPASSEPSEWEWIEVFNGSGRDIDFVETPYFLDDIAGNPLARANVSAGIIADGETGVLFRGSISPENMIAAWGEQINFIPVGTWPSLNNSGNGDTVGLWNNEVDYALDSPVEGERTFDDTVATVAYVDGGADEWPNVTDGQSISVVDLEADSNDPTNWVPSTTEDGLSHSPDVVFSSNLIDHAGGDLGTPGAFGDVVVTPTTDLDLNEDGMLDTADAAVLCRTVADEGLEINEVLATGDRLPGDLDLNGLVEFSDFLTLSGNFGKTDQHYGHGDANCDGEISFADFLVVSASFGKVAEGIVFESIPEPDGSTLMSLAVAGFLLLRTWPHPT